MEGYGKIGNHQNRNLPITLTVPSEKGKDKELSESVNCWSYCPDVIIYHALGITAELEINVLKYTLNSGNIIENANKIIKWDKTDVFYAAEKFPQVYYLQMLEYAIGNLLKFCNCVPAHAN